MKGPGELGEGDTLEVSLRLEDHLFPGPGQHEGGPSPASIHHHLTGCLPPLPAHSCPLPTLHTPANHRQRAPSAQDHSGPDRGRGRGRKKASETPKHGSAGSVERSCHRRGMKGPRLSNTLPALATEPRSVAVPASPTACSLPRACKVFMGLGKCLRPGKGGGVCVCVWRLALKHREKLQNQN